MFFSFLKKIPATYKVLIVITIIIGIVIYLRYRYNQKLIEDAKPKAPIRLVKCRHCRKLNPDEFLIETDPPQRMCDHCFKFFSKKIYKTKNPCVFLELATVDDTIGTVHIELYKDVVPKTAKNFYQLCVGKYNEELKQVIKKFMGVRFHNVMCGSLIQSGDYINGDGSSGKSIYGNTFPDENFILKHDQPGLLSMSNNGPDTNNSQFFITTRALPWLDGKHVVFGKILKGMNVIKRIENVHVDMDNKPLQDICVVNCGAIQ